MTNVAGMLVAFCGSPSDVHSVEGFCRITPIGFSKASFRRRCEALGVEAGDVVRLARLIRAADQGRRQGTRVIDQLEVDPRTYRGLLTRADVADLFGPGPPLAAELINQQRLVRNPGFIKALLDGFALRDEAREPSP